MKKHVLSIMVSLCLVFGMVAPTAAFAQPESVETEAQLAAALADASVDVIDIGADIDISSRVNITRAVTINGGGHMLTAVDDFGTGNDNKHALALLADGVVVNDLIVESAGQAFGVIAWNGGGSLNGVTIKNSKGSGLNVNGSTIVATGLVTEGNAWGAVNVDPGSGVLRPSDFTFDATSKLTERNQVWSDGRNVNESATVTIDAPATFKEYLVNGVRVILEPRTVDVADANELIAAIRDLRVGDTIQMAAGEYDIERQLGDLMVDGQDGWYLPITAPFVTLRGAGVDETHLFSSVQSPNGAWAAQNFISVFGDGVTIADMNITSKLDANKAIEIMGRDFTLNNVRINPGEGELSHGGSVYFNPQNAEKSIGDAVLENVEINRAHIAASTSAVLGGTLTLKDVTQNMEGWTYASDARFGVISSNPDVIAADGLTVNVDGTFADYQAQVASRVPAGTKVIQAVAGADAFGTSAAAALAAYPAGADTVILATGLHWADALGASALAGALDAPILLTDPAAVPDSVAAALESLAPLRIIIVGGPAAVSTAVETALEADFVVERIWGATMYETADAVAEKVLTVLGDSWDGTALFATGRSWHDALAVSPLAVEKSWPVFLVNPDTDALTTGAVAALPKMNRAYLLGGPSAIDPTVGTTVLNGGVTVSRVGGATYEETAVRVAELGVAKGLSWNRVGITRGELPFDALVGGVVQAKNGSVMLLTDSSRLGAGPAAALEAHVDAITGVTYFGGSIALPPALRAAVEAIVFGP